MNLNDPKRPPGHRFLIQLFTPQTAEEARTEVFAMFGPLKASRAVLVAGTHTWKHKYGQSGIVKGSDRWDGPGFRVYLPI